MRRTVSILLAMLVCLSAMVVGFASEEAEIKPITDYVDVNPIFGFENGAIVSSDSSDDMVAVITKNDSDDYFLNYSSDGETFASVNLTEKLLEDHLPEIAILESVRYETVQFVDGKITACGCYEFSYGEETDIIHKEILFVFDWLNDVYSFTFFDDNNKWYNKPARIAKYNDKYIYFYGRQEGIIEKSDDESRTVYGFYYVSYDLKKWEKCKIPSFDVHKIGNSFIDINVSTEGMLVLGYEFWRGSDRDTPTLKMFCKTNDFETFTDLDISALDFYEDAPYIDSIYVADLPDGSFMLMYNSLIYEERVGDHGVMWSGKYFDCYLIDIIDNTCKKIISESYQGESTIYFQRYINIYPGISIVVSNDHVIVIYTYDFVSGTVNKKTMDWDAFYEISANLSAGDYAFWDYEKEATYVIGYVRNGFTQTADNVISFVNSSYSSVYQFEVEHKNSLFTWNEQELLYLCSDDECVSVSLRHLMNALNPKESTTNTPEPTTRPAPEPTTRPAPEPLTTKPVEVTTTAPVVTEPSTTKPVEVTTTAPVVTKPSTTKPVELTTTAPVVTEPSTTRPAPEPSTVKPTEQVQTTVKPTVKPTEPVTKPTTKPVTTVPVPSVVIRTPSQTEINYGDSIIFHADTKNLPEGAYIEWTADNDNFKIVSYSLDRSNCTITPSVSGVTVFTVTVYDADGNEISSDTQTMIAKAGFFQKIIAFFKKLFGLTKIIPEAFKY